MKLLRDPLGRPIKRLYFKTEELDERCERIVAEFMDHRSGGFRLPIPTDDIIRMIEAEADDLDLYADLPESVDGYTDYFADRNPKVKISERLSSPRYENRLRMTRGTSTDTCGFTLHCGGNPGQIRTAVPPRDHGVANATRS